ncbi:hypothetical protein AAG906_006874 [Vitis piasezkii]
MSIDRYRYHVIHDISYPILMSIGNGNINYIQLPIKDDDDVRLMFHVVAQIPPSNTIEMGIRRQIDEMDENLAHNDEMGGNLAVVTQSVMGATNNYVDIPFTNENDDVEFYDEDEINEMHYDDEPPTNKVSSDDGEHIMPSPMFKQLNWDAINSMTAEPLTPRTGLWNESNELFKGLRFESKEDLQYVVKRYAICRNQHLVVCESEPQLWAVRCKKCHGMFEITKYAGPHTCVYPKLSQDHSQLDSTLIAREIQNVVQRDHTTSIATLHQIVKDKFGYDVHYRRIWEAKRKTMLRVFGDWDESYQALSKWMNILKLTNPGIKVVWKTIPLGGFTGTSRFMRVFGHLGQVLKGINAAVRNPSVGWSPPHAQHRYCLRHVVSNFNDKFKNKVLKELAYRAGCQHQPRKYERYMEELKRLDEKSVAWFSKLDTQKWTQAYDLGYRYGWMTTNIAECINGVLKGARMLPITALVQLTFYRCVSYFETRRAEIRARMAVGDVYTAYAIEKFRRAEAKASGHTVTIFHRIHETFEVITALHGFHMDKGLVISGNHLRSMLTCASFAHMRIDSWQLVEKYYRLDAYASCYAPEFNLIPHESYWPYHRTMEPGPLDPTVLHGQATHRSSAAWTGVDSKELHCRRREAIFHRTSVLDGRIIPLLQQAGFYGVARLGFISLDWHLITAFVERWRPETHTFHLPQGECTITLQDIAMLIGLPVDGDVVTGSTCLDWRRSSFLLWHRDLDEESIQRYTRAYILQLIGGFLFSGKSSDKVHLMFLPLLEDFEVVAWLYRLCRASHIDTHDISAHRFCSLMGMGEVPIYCISSFTIAPHDDQCLHLHWPFGIYYKITTNFTIMRIHPYVDDMNVGLPIITDRVLRFGFRQGIPQPCDNESILHKCDLRGRHDVDWTTRHGDYIRRWSSRREHIARGEMAIGSLGYHDPYMVWYRSITIRFLTRTGSFHELLTTSIHQIYDIAPPDDFRIRRLCTTVLEAIHEMDRLDAPFSVDATTQLQPPSGDVRPTRRGPRGVRTRGGGPHTRSSPPPHQQPISSITRSGGVRTRGGGPHTRSSPPLHQQPISPITRSGGVRTRGGGPHTRSSPPPHQQPISPITRSGGVRTRGRGAHTRGTRHTSVLRDAPSTDISLPPVQETPITPMEVPSTPPVVPLVASSPPSIEATLVHEELVHIANDDQQGQKTNRGRGHGRGRGRRRGRGAHGGLHVSPIEPLLEHAHHRRPLRKRKAPSCGTH